MHLLTKYSLESGQKIGKIHVYEKYYPLPINKYIIIQPWSKPSKNYSYWDEILSILYPILNKNNIYIVQVGGEKEEPLKFCINTQGTTSFGQLEYLISKSMLVLSTDSISAHLAGHYNKHLVTLISNNYSSAVKPFFGEQNKQIILEPLVRNELKPLFTDNENGKKQIDTIPPELIINSVLKLLNLGENFNYKSISIGSNYNNKGVESLCDDVIDVNKIGCALIGMRMDYNYNLNVLTKQLSFSKCHIITKKEIPIDILNNFKNNITGVVYEITENHNPNFIKNLIDLKIPYQLVSNLTEEKIDLIKLDYMDYGIIYQINNSKIKDKIKNQKEKVFYKSSKLLISKGKFYQTYCDYLNGRNFNPMNIQLQEIIDKNIEELYSESHSCIFYIKS